MIDYSLSTFKKHRPRVLAAHEKDVARDRKLEAAYTKVDLRAGKV